MLSQFIHITKKKAPRDKHAAIKQTGLVAFLNQEFQKILMDMPHISQEEAVDSYTRGLKRYIYSHICTKTYESLDKVMVDATNT